MLPVIITADRETFKLIAELLICVPSHEVSNSELEKLMNVAHQIEKQLEE